jgi:Na+-transporting methylmalonyl-CoA/oxaloacetate decarboxylase gamma subunit
MVAEVKNTGMSSRSKRLVVWSIVGITIVVVVMLLLVYGLGGVMQGVQRVQPPSVQVTSENVRTGNIGLDYVAWVDVSVHNSGGPGTVTVWVEVTQGYDSWKKSQTIYLDAKGSRDLTFEFREVGFWTTNPINYRVWVTY